MPRPIAKPGTRADRFAQRSPIDLHDPRLRKLAAALAPAYLRVSGTPANQHLRCGYRYPAHGAAGRLQRRPDTATMAKRRSTSPTRSTLRCVTSFAISAGTRDAGGRWTQVQAERLLALTRCGRRTHRRCRVHERARSAGDRRRSDGYDAGAYGRDFAAFPGVDQERSTCCHDPRPGTGRHQRADAAALFCCDSFTGIDEAGLPYHHYGALSAFAATAIARRRLRCRTNGWCEPETTLPHSIERCGTGFRAGQADLADQSTAETACCGKPLGRDPSSTLRLLDQPRTTCESRRSGGDRTTRCRQRLWPARRADPSATPEPHRAAPAFLRRLNGTSVLERGCRTAAPASKIYALFARDRPGDVAFRSSSTARRGSGAS